MSQRTSHAGLEQVFDEDADHFHSACRVQRAPGLEPAVAADQQLSGLMLHAVLGHHAEDYHSLHVSSKQIAIAVNRLHKLYTDCSSSTQIAINRLSAEALKHVNPISAADQTAVVTTTNDLQSSCIAGNAAYISDFICKTGDQTMQSFCTVCSMTLG